MLTTHNSHIVFGSPPYESIFNKAAALMQTRCGAVGPCSAAAAHIYYSNKRGFLISKALMSRHMCRASLPPCSLMCSVPLFTETKHTLVAHVFHLAKLIRCSHTLNMWCYKTSLHRTSFFWFLCRDIKYRICNVQLFLSHYYALCVCLFIFYFDCCHFVIIKFSVSLDSPLLWFWTPLHLPQLLQIPAMTVKLWY